MSRNHDLTSLLTDHGFTISRLSVSTAALCVGAALLAGCSGGIGAPQEIDDPVDESDPTVTETLESLGVDSTETPPTDETGAPLPEDYSPLGARHELEKLSELIVLGVAPQGSEDELTLWDLEFSPEFPDQGPRLLNSFAPETVPWAGEQHEGLGVPITRRAGMSADLDGDGREEQVFAHFDEEWMHFTIIEDAESEYALTETEVFPLYADGLDVNVVAADADGDGDQEIVLGYSRPHLATLSIFDFEDGAVDTEPMIEVTFEPRYQGNLLMLELATGNLDYDPKEELGLVVNEFFIDLDHPTAFVNGEGCTAYVLDDLGQELAALEVFPIEIIGDFDTLHSATSADLDFGDLDADGLDEIVIAGSANRSGDYCLGRYVLISLDDAVRGLEDLGSEYLEHEIPDGEEAIVNWAHVDLVDLEGDHACEVHVNEIVFAQWERGEMWSEAESLGTCYPVTGGVCPSVFSFAVADYTGDLRQDLAVIARGRNEVVIWGIAAEDSDQELAILERIPLDYGVSSLDCNPQLIPVNPDSDSTLLEFIEHSYVLTEPVVMAVLTAAPSIGSEGQNSDANTTEFGTSQSSSTGSEHQLSVSLGFVVGSEFKLWGNGWEVEASLQADFEQVWSSSREVTTGMAFATGAEEDSVVCTVAPYDVYTYRVVMDPDPESIGKTVQLMIPRTPITLQVERDYFNRAVGKNSIQIDESVLTHTIGDVSSYPSEIEKDGILAVHQGLQTGTALVGLGSSSETSVNIEVSTETGGSTYLGVTTEFSASTTVGSVKVGGSLGLGYGHTWSWAIGQSTSYSGTVGSIDEEHYADEHFRFGLFCYWDQAEGSDQRFQVINYWIE